MGYAGAATPVDTVTVQLLSHSQYPDHYRFKDTLQIFSPTVAASVAQWTLEYDNQLNRYVLAVGAKRYLLKRGFTRIARLKTE